MAAVAAGTGSWRPWLLVRRGWRRTGMTLAALCLGALWLVATPWVARALALPLESQYPPVTVQAAPDADAVLVPLMAAQPPSQPRVNLDSAADRVWHAGALYRAGKARWVSISGGNLPRFAHLPREAQAMAEVLRGLGVPDTPIRLEGRSRNTLENARESLTLVPQVGARRALLVTSALHMSRALAVFEAVFAGSGVTLLPAATDAEALGDVHASKPRCNAPGIR